MPNQCKIRLVLVAAVLRTFLPATLYSRPLGFRKMESPRLGIHRLQRKSERIESGVKLQLKPAYLAFAATGSSGFEKWFSSSLGFTMTFSTMIFSLGTTGSLNPFAVRATWRTFVSKRCAI